MSATTDSFRDRFLGALVTATTVAFAIPGSLIFASLAILVAWVPPRGDGTFFCGRVWARCLLAAAGIRVRVEQADPLAAPGGCVFLANHASWFDIPAMLATCPRSLRFAAKRSLFHIPIFGWALAVGGFIPVDRADKSRAKDVWAAAGRRLAAGASVLFFPEGTRSSTGEVGEFQRGGFLVALKTGAPIVPVGIEGTHAVLPRGRYRIRPGPVTVRYGAPIDPASYGVARKRELIAVVHAEVVRLSGTSFLQNPPEA